MPSVQGLPTSGGISGNARQTPVSLRVPAFIVFANLFVLLLPFVADVPCQGAALDFRIEQQEGTDLILVRMPKAGVHKLEIDDAFEFRTPVVVQTFSGSGFQFQANEA